MIIKELRISNILSFAYSENIAEATKIEVDRDLNIFIGENGSGKSTALEVINFVFKKVLFTQFNVNQDYYSRKSRITADERRQILTPANNTSVSEFRLNPNWNTSSDPQKIWLTIKLDEIDDANIKNLIANWEKIDRLASLYTQHSSKPELPKQCEYAVEVSLNYDSNSFSSKITPEDDPGFRYLVDYNFYKELIDFYNLENQRKQIPSLYESFMLIGGYRNYHSFNPSVSLSGSTAGQQIQKIRVGNYSKSLNSSEDSEPSIFNLVRLRVAAAHYELFGETKTRADSEELANKQEFLRKINRRLKLVNLEVKISFLDKQTWAYSFQLLDLKRGETVTDINSLSAGQKAIVHLVFEAYGRGDLKGGLVIIDEPEIHLHYQFQNEYLNVINEINKEQSCQYILVTHSESLINSSTIGRVKRFALDSENNTVVKAPAITADEKTLIKILDNTRSTYAFFGKKVILVEGETDRYFLKEVIQRLNPELVQEIAVLDIMGKPQEPEWRAFFESFGLRVYFVGDFDNLCKIYGINPAPKLRTPESIATFKLDHPSWEADIKSQYRNKIFILKEGALEYYLGLEKKDLGETVRFCSEKLDAFLNERGNEKVKNIKDIYRKIIKN